jgi:hypothetical protein
VGLTLPNSSGWPELLSPLAEVEDAAAAVGLAVEAHAPELPEGQLANRLAAAGALLARLRTLRAMLPREGEPDPSEAPTDVP